MWPWPSERALRSVKGIADSIISSRVLVVLFMAHRSPIFESVKFVAFISRTTIYSDPTYLSSIRCPVTVLGPKGAADLSAARP